MYEMSPPFTDPVNSSVSCHFQRQHEAKQAEDIVLLKQRSHINIVGSMSHAASKAIILY